MNSFLPSRSDKSWIKWFDIIGGCDDYDAFILFKTIHFNQKLIQCHLCCWLVFQISTRGKIEKSKKEKRRVIYKRGGDIKMWKAFEKIDRDAIHR